MTNDISTLNGALNGLGETLADNLSQMGVDDAVASDGLTTLAGKILDIEPSIAGLELSTSIDCNVSSNEILLGQSVVFSATLSASYDDTSIEDIDISGVLTGATVLFKTSGGVILGSGVTDVNGVATYTHTFEDIGSIVVHAEFGGSTNFNSCISQNGVTVECSYDFDVTVDKEILSANDNDIATFNCILSDSTGVIVGESIDYQILHNDTILDEGTLTTDNTGKITLDYAATGVGNVTVVFSLRSILQKTYELEDCFLSDDLTSAKHTWTKIDNNTTFSFTENGLVTQGSTGGCYLKLDETYPTTAYSVEFDIVDFIGSNELKGGSFVVENVFIQSTNSNSLVAVLGDTTTLSYDGVMNVNDHMKIIYDGSTVSFYVNDVLFGTLNKGTAQYTGFEIRNVRTSGVTIKNLKIKAL